MLIKQGDDDKVMEAGSNLNTIWAMMNSSSGSQPLYDSRCVMTVEGWCVESLPVSTDVAVTEHHARTPASMPPSPHHVLGGF